MVKTKDILIYVAIVLFWFISTILIVVMTEYRFLAFLPSVLAISLKIYLIRKKRIFDFVKDDFQILGYELIEERPLKFKEFFVVSNIEFKPTIFIGNVPISRLKYIATFRRVFIAKTKDEKFYELNAFVGEKWNGGIEIEIMNRKMFANSNKGHASLLKH
jgi:hypothetical protein